MQHGYFCIVMSCAVALVACSSENKPPPRAPAAPIQNASPPVPEAVPVQRKVTLTQVAIDENIRIACGLTRAEAYFAYDSAKLRSEDLSVFRKLADCFTSGPMRDEEILLVGRADPRGGTEYNFVLGDHRAQSVAQQLKSLDVDGDQIHTSSRGELDATGTDEASWARDRRVNIKLYD